MPKHQEGRALASANAPIGLVPTEWRSEQVLAIGNPRALESGAEVPFLTATPEDVAKLTGILMPIMRLAGGPEGPEFRAGLSAAIGALVVASDMAEEEDGIVDSLAGYLPREWTVERGRLRLELLSQIVDLIKKFDKKTKAIRP